MDKAERIDFPADGDRNRLLSLIGLLLGYFIALLWLGQTISSALFCILLMRVLSNLSWLRIVAYSLATFRKLWLLGLAPMISGCSCAEW